MTWDDGRYDGGTWKREPAPADTSGRALVAPVAAGLAAALVIHIALFTVVLAAAVGVTDPGDEFGTGAALWWGTLGALGLAVAVAVGARVGLWVAGIRAVNAERARRTVRFALGAFVVVLLALGLAPALRLYTLPIYLVLAAGGLMAATSRRT